MGDVADDGVGAVAAGIQVGVVYADRPASAAVGATLFTDTDVEYSVKPPSLSMIRARTVYAPLSSYVHCAEASPLATA